METKQKEKNTQQYNNNEQVTCSMMEDIDWQQCRSQFTIFVYSICAGFFFSSSCLSRFVCVSLAIGQAKESNWKVWQRSYPKNHLIKYEEKKKTTKWNIVQSVRSFQQIYYITFIIIIVWSFEAQRMLFFVSFFFVPSLYHYKIEACISHDMSYILVSCVSWLFFFVVGSSWFFIDDGICSIRFVCMKSVLEHRARRVFELLSPIPNWKADTFFS